MAAGPYSPIARLEWARHANGDSRLSSTARALLPFLAECTNAVTGEFWKSAGTIASACCYRHERSAREGLHELVEAGWLEVAAPPGTRTYNVPLTGEKKPLLSVTYDITYPSDWTAPRKKSAGVPRNKRSGVKASNGSQTPRKNSAADPGKKPSPTPEESRANPGMSVPPNKGREQGGEHGIEQDPSRARESTDSSSLSLDDALRAYFNKTTATPMSDTSHDVEDAKLLLGTWGPGVVFDVIAELSAALGGEAPDRLNVLVEVMKRPCTAKPNRSGAA